MRVGAIVVELGGLVLGKFEEGTCGELHVLVDVKVPSSKEAGFNIGNYAAGPLLAVLITPIGIVLIVVGKPVGLVRAGTCRSTFCGVGPGSKVQRVLFVNDFLYRHKGRKAIIESSLDVCCLHVRPAVSDGTEEGPSGFAQACAIGVHTAKGIVAVGT